MSLCQNRKRHPLEVCFVPDPVEVLLGRLVLPQRPFERAFRVSMPNTAKGWPILSGECESFRVFRVNRVGFLNVSSLSGEAQGHARAIAESAYLFNVLPFGCSSCPLSTSKIRFADLSGPEAQEVLIAQDWETEGSGPSQRDLAGPSQLWQDSIPLVFWVWNIAAAPMLDSRRRTFVVCFKLTGILCVWHSAVGMDTRNDSC